MARDAILALVLGLGLLPCEVTVEAERGDYETMIVCSVSAPPDWWTTLRRLFRSVANRT